MKNEKMAARDYVAPAVEVIDVAVEAGFAASAGDMGDGGSFDPTRSW